MVVVLRTLHALLLSTGLEAGAPGCEAVESSAGGAAALQEKGSALLNSGRRRQAPGQALPVYLAALRAALTERG